MEKLNEFLQTLLSTCSYELHLAPNKIPSVVSGSGTTDVAGAPLSGAQISMMVFPLIPPRAKQQLPNRDEIEFVHNHALGAFGFTVKKSPAGFIVTVRPTLGEDGALHSSQAPEANQSTVSDDAADSQIAPPLENTYAPVSSFSNAAPEESAAPVLSAQSLSSEETSAPAAKTNFQSDYSSAEIETETGAYDGGNFPTVETLPVYDPQFSTTFSDTSTYEPPLRPQEFAADYAAQNESSFENRAQPNFQPTQFVAPVQMKAEPNEFAAKNANPQMRKRMDALFYRMAEVGASDLHLSATMPPLVRKDGKIQPLESAESTLSPELIKELLTAIMPQKNQEEFARRHDTDFAYEIENLARFRANIFMDRKGMGAVFRIIPAKITTAEQLGLSKPILDLCNLSKGLVVVTGPTGSGKSTTLCAMVNHINFQREDHIITIEDPIEFTHENQKCLVNQREVHNHTDSFKDALRAALREDPDILLVGEMRDLETISIAIETAETGHLVFGTLHTTTAASTVDRIIDQFPADRQQQIRVMLSESLKGVIAQTLLPKKGGGRVAAMEVLIVTPAISNLIREGKTFQIPSAMQTGKAHGMVVLNDALFDLVKRGLVEPRDAYVKAVDKTNFEAQLTRSGFKI